MVALHVDRGGAYPESGSDNNRRFAALDGGAKGVDLAGRPAVIATCAGVDWRRGNFGCRQSPVGGPWRRFPEKHVERRGRRRDPAPWVDCWGGCLAGAEPGVDRDLGASRKAPGDLGGAQTLGAERVEPRELVLTPARGPAHARPRARRRLIAARVPARRSQNAYRSPVAIVRNAAPWRLTTTNSRRLNGYRRGSVVT